MKKFTQIFIPNILKSLSKYNLSPETNQYASQLNQMRDFLMKRHPEIRKELQVIDFPDLSKKYKITPKPKVQPRAKI